MSTPSLKPFPLGPGRRLTLLDLQSLIIDSTLTLEIFNPSAEKKSPPSATFLPPTPQQTISEQNVENIKSIPNLPKQAFVLYVTLLAHHLFQVPGVQIDDELVGDLIRAGNWVISNVEDSWDMSPLPTNLLPLLTSVPLPKTFPLPSLNTLHQTLLPTLNLLRLTPLIDPIASLSVLRLQNKNEIDVTSFSEDAFDVGRPHVGMINSAQTVRLLIEGSPITKTTSSNSSLPLSSTPSTCSKACMQIPSIHGVLTTQLSAHAKSFELEVNSKLPTLNNDSSVRDNTLLSILEVSCSIIARTLSVSSMSRSGINDGTVLGVVGSYGNEVGVCRVAVEGEGRLNLQWVAEERAKKGESSEEVVEVVAVVEAVSDDAKEFEGKSVEQIAKIKRIREEKNAKAAKKAAAKAAKKSGASASSSGLSPGCASVASILSGSGSHFFSQSVIDEISLVLTKLSSGGTRRKPKLPKGTRDYLPDQMSIRSLAFSTIRAVFLRHGASEIDTPVFELKETLTGKYGEDSKLIYDLADQGGEVLALRYDLTVPFARFLASNSVGNIKRFHIGKVYRRDQPNIAKGRYREFYQCDFDIAGSQGSFGRMVPDSECLVVVCEILDELDIGSFQVKLNHRKLLDAILEVCGVGSDKFRQICSAVDKLDKEPWSAVKDEMIDKGVKAEVADAIGKFVLRKSDPADPWSLYNQLVQEKAFGDHKGAADALEDIRVLFTYLEAMGKLHFISFDLSLARGLDYYTGVIYEAVCLSGNVQVGSIGGGGRYDKLVGMFQAEGKETPCVGVSVGIERVFTLMEQRLRDRQNGSIKTNNVDVLIASSGGEMMLEKMKIARLLWNEGVSCEFNQSATSKLKNELTNALDRAIPYMVIVGADELVRGEVKVKDLAKRIEEVVSIEMLGERLREMGVVCVKGVSSVKEVAEEVAKMEISE